MIRLMIDLFIHSFIHSFIHGDDDDVVIDDVDLL